MLFEGRYKTQDYFRFFLYLFCSILHLSEKQNGAYCCLPSKNRLVIHYLYSKDGFTYDQSIQYKMLLVRLHVYRSINSLPHMAILGYRDMMSKIWINGDTII